MAEFLIRAKENHKGGRFLRSRVVAPDPGEAMRVWSIYEHETARYPHRLLKDYTVECLTIDGRDAWEAHYGR